MMSRVSVDRFELRPPETLSERESEVAALVVQGLPNKIIARRLGIREGTVKVHLHRIYSKLGIENRFELMATRKHK